MPETESWELLGVKALFASAPMRRLLDLVRRVARTNEAVLVTGESGSGKEVIARAIHHFSLRASRDWVDINCAAIPEHLMESELFGYEKGAFSGALGSKPGLLELADKGTLFLDELGELDGKLQAKLLRVLDHVPYYRVGGTKKVSSDVRLIAATNQDLERMISEGKFRHDLYHRLSGMEVRIPPLRERPEDVDVLADQHLERSYPGTFLTDDARERLRSYAWPGNIRELRHVLSRSALLVDDGRITAARLQLPQTGASAAPVAQTSHNLEVLERQAIRRALEETRNHYGRAAGLLGISTKTLGRKVKAYGLEAVSQY
ncbi:MAG: sigma-54 dependent transcriptional regulator [Bryobacteraceae bacterium]|nr:sigma-54 dependent transcriptional regulator [Bryobacteraceae bacterium]